MYSGYFFKSRFSLGYIKKIEEGTRDSLRQGRYLSGMTSSGTVSHGMTFNLIDNVV